MGGRNKALLDLAGKPLLQHVVDRVAAQVDELALCIESSPASIAALGVVQLPDPEPGHRGPLGGVLSALRHFSPVSPWLLVVPCDAPFLPLDLGLRLQARAQDADAPCAVIQWRGRRQPTFAIWHRRLLPDLEQAVREEGFASLWSFQERCRAVTLEWVLEDDALAPSPFFNINDPAALDEARSWLHEEAPGRCSA
jgi:molybdopterin-guanine dinucleotide biosynthesis protein A